MFGSKADKHVKSPTATKPREPGPPQEPPVAPAGPRITKAIHLGLIDDERPIHTFEGEIGFIDLVMLHSYLGELVSEEWRHRRGQAALAVAAQAKENAERAKEAAEAAEVAAQALISPLAGAGTVPVGGAPVDPLGPLR